jgi:preprotein translocase subunit SecY
MWQTLLKVVHDKTLRHKIVFVLALLVVLRIAAHIPIPGINVAALQALFANNAYLGVLNIFSGGALENFSLVMLGVGPYITASIIFQLLGMMIPQLEEMQKETDGQRKIQQWTRYLAVPMAIVQGYGTITVLQRTSGGVLGDLSIWQYVIAITLITGGSIFAMWIGELITEKNIGNGISLIIAAGIVASLPLTVQQVLAVYDPSQLPTIVFYIAIAIVIIFAVVYITEGQRNIPISSVTPCASP